MENSSREYRDGVEAGSLGDVDERLFQSKKIGEAADGLLTEFNQRIDIAAIFVEIVPQYRWVSDSRLSRSCQLAVKYGGSAID